MYLATSYNDNDKKEKVLGRTKSWKTHNFWLKRGLHLAGFHLLPVNSPDFQILKIYDVFFAKTTVTLNL